MTNYVNLAIAGGYANSPTSKIYNSQLSHCGDRMLVEGVFTSIGGRPRQQIAMLNMATPSVTMNS